MPRFSSLLIANRGEIALRVMRTARERGLETVAVYSEADADAPHVRFADKAYPIGAAPVGDSYLSVERLLEAAAETGAQAIHPGYGFLSENAGFARAVEKAGLVFVGPPADAIDIMGDKARAKRRMIEAGVPCVPGYEGEDQADERFLRAAAEIGFPVMVKAAAGGGGRGMRLVTSAEDLPNALGLARSEAQNAFGSGALILEKAILQPRHVEIQVFADSQGQAVHLGERDCSVQRRHQKVVEEAPCPVMTPELRTRMGTAAVEAARAVNYVGAGTVEFLLDKAGEFYFLEMNTRLQVEHPVTEMVTGLDLVALQLSVAQGDPLGLEQDDIQLEGHAIEVRLYAEDPAQDFLPATGPVRLWQEPAGPGIRVDAGIETGSAISPYYDPMLAKIMAHGATREEARIRLRNALSDCALFGAQTNRDFLIDVLEQPAFASGSATTAFIAETYGEAGWSPEDLAAEDGAVAAVLQHALGLRRARADALRVSPELLDWSSDGSLRSVYAYRVAGDVRTIDVVPLGRGDYRVEADDAAVSVRILSLGESQAEIELGTRKRRAIFLEDGPHTLHLALDDRSFAVTDLAGNPVAADEAAGGGRVTAPMHGVLLEVLVEEGQRVEKGARLAILEAMKMQHEIVADTAGRVVSLAAAAGQQIAGDDLILEIEPDGEDRA